MFTAWRIIRKPTNTIAGATASKGTMVTRGVRKIATRNSTPVTIFAKPVRAPAPIPVADSTKIWLEEEEVPPPATEPRASTSRTLSTFSIWPSLMVPASVARPTEVPIASKKAEIRMVKISRTAAMPPRVPKALNRSAEPNSEKSGSLLVLESQTGTFRDQPVGEV